MATWHKTKYPGVRYKLNNWPGKPGKKMKVYWGRISQKTYKLGTEAEGCTPAGANRILVGLKQKKLIPADEFQGKTFDDGWEIFGNTFDDNKDCRKRDLPSWRADDNRWSKYISPRFGHKEVNSLTSTAIDQFKADLKAAPVLSSAGRQMYKNGQPRTLSAQTRKHIIALLGKAASAVGHDLKIKTPKVKNEKVDQPDSDLHYRSFILHLQEYNIPRPKTAVADMMLIACYTGMRRTEIVNLKWEDIDFANKTLFIGEQKNGERSNIPLNQLALDVLSKQPQTSSYVFPSDSGSSRYPDAVTLTAGRISRKFGLPSDHRPMHSLRHWFASNLASSGQVDQYLLQQLLRHKSPEMTQRYSHLSNRAFDRARSAALEVL